MQVLTLTPKEGTFNLSIELDDINPANIVKSGQKDCKDLPVLEGSKRWSLGELFDISGTVASNPAEQKIVFKNSSSLFKGIGKKLSEGKIQVQGDAGSFLGSEMTGGKITVHGNVGQYVGMEMKDGSIEVDGDAGNYLGAAYWGNWEGMTGGKIVVNGGVGHECGPWMKGGLIEIKGRAGDFLGIHMTGEKATIVTGGTGIRAGGEMITGRIIVLSPATILPTFKKNPDPVKEVEITADNKLSGPFDLYEGDFAEQKRPKIPRGQIFVKGK
ncbi:MAG: formylmethanofuran dehydrogenase subunit C [Candidatus Hodarchaeota archaeon]